MAMQAVRERSTLFEKAGQRLTRAQEKVRQAQIDLDETILRMSEIMEEVDAAFPRVEEEGPIPAGYSERISCLKQERGTLLWRSEVCKTLVTEGHRTDAIAAEIGVKDRYVRGMIAIADLGQELKGYIRQNIIAATYAAEWRSRSGEADCVQFIRDFLNHRKVNPGIDREIRKGENLITESVVTYYYAQKDQSGR